MFLSDLQAVWDSQPEKLIFTSPLTNTSLHTSDSSSEYTSSILLSVCSTVPSNPFPPADDTVPPFYPEKLTKFIPLHHHTVRAVQQYANKPLFFFFPALTRGPVAKWRARCGVVRFGDVICLRTYAQTQQSRRWLKELQLEISAGTVGVIGWWITSARGKLIPSYPECTGNMIRTIGQMCCGASELEFVKITCL